MNTFLRCAVVVLSLLSMAGAEPISFRRAIELANKNSGASAIASAELVRAQQSYLELKNLYLPQVTAGSGLGYSAGFPLSLEGAAPSIFNVNTQQYVLNLPNQSLMHAARLDWKAAESQKQDTHDQVTLETALTYIQLDQLTSAISVMRQEEQAVARSLDITQQRVREGVDSELELTRAQLSAARLRMRIAQAQGAADVLRLRLGQLIGLPGNSVETMPESIPDLPAPQDPDPVAKAVAVSPAIKAADEQAQAKQLRANSEHRQFLPTIDFAVQYAVLARFNNYDEFFLKFQRNNVTAGINIRFPFLNFSQRAHAEAADADAVKARRQADAVRDQVSTETMKLRRMVQQLSAARDVAQLEHRLARADVDAVQARIDAGAATLRDQENARAAEHDKYAAFIDASFQLQKAELQLLRATGELQEWALSAK